MPAPPRLDEQSDALHARVTLYGKSALEGNTTEDSFDDLAVAIARYQRAASPGYARLVERHGSTLDTLESIPAVPVDAFRLTRVATHQPEDDLATFRTSGTTGTESGLHHFRTLDTYRTLSTKLGQLALFSAWDGPKTIVSLTSAPVVPPVSSLTFMVQAFIETFDGRALTRQPEGVPFRSDSPERWLAGPGGVDVDGLKRAAKVAKARSEPLFVLATSFALVGLLDVLDGELLPCPGRTVVMQTGGFKGRSREVDPDELRREVARAFRTIPDHVVGEYGMTELSSQLYEGCLPGAGLSGPKGVYLEPPWLRVIPVRPSTLEPVSDGEPGLAKIIDLANVDSAVAVVTGDVVRRRDGGVELLGRRPGAPARGCSLPYEGLVPAGGAR